jgi:hypothetical protein
LASAFSCICVRRLIRPTGKGKHVFKKQQAIYDGDWANDQRSGYGVFTRLQGVEYVKVYAGAWKDDKRHV